MNSRSTQQIKLPINHRLTSTQFVNHFYELQLPVPNKPTKLPVQFNQELNLNSPEFKSDLKLVLQIATQTRLKCQQDKKQQEVLIFYCRSMGLKCFKIQVMILAETFQYIVKSDYHELKHEYKCELQSEPQQVLRLYNLMMLKRGLIEKYVIENDLLNKSPENILTKISYEADMENNSTKIPNQYFYAHNIHQIEDRRKLKKRFDNIINITIKKKYEKILQNIPKNVSIKQLAKEPKQLQKEKGTSSKKLESIKNKKKQKQLKKYRKKCSKISYDEISEEESADIYSQSQLKQNIINQQPVKPPLIKYKLDRSCKKINQNRSNKQINTKKLRSSIENKIYQSDEESVQYNDKQNVDKNVSQKYFASRSSRKNSLQRVRFENSDKIIYDDDSDNSGSSFDAEKAMNQIQNNSCWCISKPSIVQAIDIGERMRMDDLFSSLRNSLLKSVQKKSLREIEPNITNIFASKQSNN